MQLGTVEFTPRNLSILQAALGIHTSHRLPLYSYSSLGFPTIMTKMSTILASSSRIVSNRAIDQRHTVHLVLF
jgi:hypothetical protein